MRSGKQQDLLRPLEFLQIADVLAVNPHPGTSGSPVFRVELDLPQYLVFCFQVPAQEHRSEEQEERKQGFYPLGSHLINTRMSRYLTVHS